MWYILTEVVNSDLVLLTMSWSWSGKIHALLKFSMYGPKKSDMWHPQKLNVWYIFYQK